MTKWVNGMKKNYAKKIAYQAGYAPAATHARPRPPPPADVSGEEGGGLAAGPPRAPAADGAAAPRLSLGPRADGAHDRAAHGRGGVRGRRRCPRRRRREAPRRARRPALPGLLPRAARSRSKTTGTSRRWRAASTTKLVRRHPHVFGDVEARTAARVRENWERIKREQEGREGVFHDVPESAARAAVRAEDPAARGLRRASSTPTSPARSPISTTSCASCGTRSTCTASPPRRRSPTRARPRSSATCCSHA